MITVLSGGTGTPKLLQGLKEIVDPSELTIVVNTLENDYFAGVYVAADIDTVLYTMSDMITVQISSLNSVTPTKMQKMLYYSELGQGYIKVRNAEFGYFSPFFGNVLLTAIHTLC